MYFEILTNLKTESGCFFWIGSMKHLFGLLTKLQGNPII